MHLAPRSLRTAALVLLAPTVPALQQLPLEEWHSIPLPPDLEDLDPCTASSAGHLFGKLGTDVVLLYGDRPIVYKEPEVYRAPVDVAVVASDLVVYPRNGAGPDWLLAVGPAGLTRWTWDGTAFVDDSRNPPVSPWYDAVAVGVANLDGANDLDVYGLDATRRKVILSRVAPMVWETSAVISFERDIEAITTVRWSSSPVQVLALRTADTLFLVDFRGVVLREFALPGTPGPLAAVDIPGSTQQAVVVSDGGSPSSFRVYAKGFSGQLVEVEDHTIVGWSFGDLDLDGVADLVTSHPSGPTLDLWRGTPAEGALHFQAFPGVEEIQVPSWTTFAQNEAPPGLADFDQDGDLDVLFSPVGTQRVDLFSNTQVDEDAFLCHPLAGAMTANATGGLFQLTLRVPPAAASGDWTDMEVLVWQQPRFDYLLESTPFLAPTFHPITGLSEVTIEVQTPYQTWFETIYHVEARLVRREAGVKVAQGPGETAMLGLSEPLMALCEIEGVLGEGGEFTGVTFEVPPQFEYPWPHPIDPVPVGVPGDPNPRYEDSDVTYEYNALVGTFGGGSGCLPDVPDAGSNDPPQN